MFCESYFKGKEMSSPLFSSCRSVMNVLRLMLYIMYAACCTRASNFPDTVSEPMQTTGDLSRGAYDMPTLYCPCT